MRCVNKPTAHPAQPAWPVRAELIASHQCSASGIAAHGYTPVLGLCRKLIDSGINPATALHVYRGDTLCLIVRSIGAGARLEISGDGTGFRRLRQPDAAPSVAPTARRLIQHHKQAAARKLIASKSYGERRGARS